MIKMMIADRRFNIDKNRLKTLVSRVLKGESAGKKTINIVYCADKLIGDLNRRFLKKNRATDVLAFELNDNENKGFLGEVYVNLQQARRQAADNNIIYKEEVGRLTIHGVLHLLGYDDLKDTSRLKMWNRQESYLEEWKK